MAPGAAVSSPAEALQALLSEQPSGLRAVLAPLCEVLLGPLTPTGPAPEAGLGAPDGLDGIRRRGPWERLLHSEIALLDAIPDEFLRRAVDGELQFHELAREAPAPPARVVVWLDGGPDSIGRARTVQAAVLVVLQAHATALGVPFVWGVLGDAVPVEGMTEGWLALLRAQRSLVRPPLPATLGCLGDSVLVVLGLPTLPRDGVQQLVLETRHGVLGCTLNGRGLPLPAVPAHASARLLRPQHGRKPELPGAPFAAQPGFFFSPSGARLLAWSTETHEAIAIPAVARSGRREHRARFTGRLFGVGWAKQRLVVLELRGDGEGGLLRGDRFYAVPDLSALAGWPGAVHMLVRKGSDGVRALCPPPVRLVASAGGGLDLGMPSTLTGATVQWDGTVHPPGPERLAVVRMSSIGALEQTPAGGRRFVGGPVDRTLTGAPLLVLGGLRSLWVFRQDGADGWLLMEEGSYAVSNAFAHVRVVGDLVGVVGVGPGRQECPVALRDGQLFVHRYPHAPPQSIAADVVSGAVSPAGDRLAWLDSAGTLHLYDAREQCVLRTWSPP